MHELEQIVIQSGIQFLTKGQDNSFKQLAHSLIPTAKRFSKSVVERTLNRFMPKKLPLWKRVLIKMQDYAGNHPLVFLAFMIVILLLPFGVIGLMRMNSLDKELKSKLVFNNSGGGGIFGGQSKSVLNVDASILELEKFYASKGINVTNFRDDILRSHPELTVDEVNEVLLQQLAPDSKFQLFTTAITERINTYYIWLRSKFTDFFGMRFARTFDSIMGGLWRIIKTIFFTGIIAGTVTTIATNFLNNLFGNTFRTAMRGITSGLFEKRDNMVMSLIAKGINKLYDLFLAGWNKITSKFF